MLQLRPECVEPLRRFITAKKGEIVTCIFDTNIQFEELDETHLLPKDVMRIVYDYFDDKVIVDCSHDSIFNNEIVLFNINDNNNKIVYNYYHRYNMLTISEDNFNQKDDSITNISSSIEYFNLSRLYYHYMSNDDSTFDTQNGEKSTVIVDNNKYTITLRYATYVSVILDHEILQRRIIVMKQLIDIIGKN